MLFFKSSTAIEYIFASGVLGEKKGASCGINAWGFALRFQVNMLK